MKKSRLWNHLYDFPYIWLIILLWLVVAVIFFCNGTGSVAKYIGYFTLFGTVVLLIAKPMNAVYGLMGTSGSIRLFFLNFLFITLLFAGIYHFGFFKNTGISYDVNQPHIDYRMFADSGEEDSVKITSVRDTIFLEHIIDSTIVKEAVVHVSTEELHYQRVSFFDVWKCTILTTLTQEPVDLFACAAIYNEAMDGGDCELDKQKTDLFHWILIFHIIISWIFFGVFISLLYNKFRYES